MLQWKATNLPVLSASFFSVPLSSGLLNPGQSVSVAVEYAPKMHGFHSSVLAISTSLLQGGGQVKDVAVQLQGEGKGKVGAALLMGELCLAPPFLLWPPPGVEDVEVWREAGREEDLVKGGGVVVREEGELSG